MTESKQEETKKVGRPPANKEKIADATSENLPVPESKDVKDEKISVNKSKLEAILKNMEDMKSNINRLESAANKARLGKYDSSQQGIKEKIVRLLIIEGKVITSWDKMIVNKVGKDETGKWGEEQKVLLHFEDGTEKEMHYVFFSRHYTHIPALVKSETKNMSQEDIDKFGAYIFHVETLNEGIKYDIGSNFIN